MTLIARAPLRVSFGGDGTGLSAYYEKHEGLAVTTSIGYAFHTTLTSSPADGVQILSTDHRAPSNTPVCGDLNTDQAHQLARAIVDFFNPQKGGTVFLASQVPSGAGLGACGALTVSMIKALSFWCGIDLEPGAAADIACRIQVDHMGVVLGSQDPYAVAFGGTNRIEFSADGVVVEPLNMPAGTEEALQERLMLFFAHVSGSSSEILRRLRQSVLKEDDQTLRRLTTIKALASEVSDALEQGNLPAVGELLHRSWMEKRHLTQGVTDDFIDRCYEAARACGALGGKMCGAGGGGFLMLYCAEEHQDEVTAALEALGLRKWPLTLDRTGVRLLEAKPWRRLGSSEPGWSTEAPEEIRQRPAAAVWQDLRTPGQRSATE